MVLRSTRNLPFFLACPQMCVNPRKLKVSGLPPPTLLPTCCYKTPELNQACFIRM